MLTFKHTGRFENILNFLKRAPQIDYQRILNTYGAQGVSALMANTPVDTGVTKSSWGYSTKISGDQCSIIWTNSNTTGGTPIVILIQYGHGTRQGRYVHGRDFINPALLPVFQRLSEEVWREVQAL